MSKEVRQTYTDYKMKCFGHEGVLFVYVEKATQESKSLQLCRGEFERHGLRLHDKLETFTEALKHKFAWTSKTHLWRQVCDLLFSNFRGSTLSWCKTFDWKYTHDMLAQ